MCLVDEVPSWLVSTADTSPSGGEATTLVALLHVPKRDDLPDHLTNWATPSNRRQPAGRTILHSCEGRNGLRGGPDLPAAPGVQALRLTCAEST